MTPQEMADLVNLPGDDAMGMSKVNDADELREYLLAHGVTMTAEGAVPTELLR